MSISYGLVFSATIFEYIVCNAGGPQFDSWVGRIPCRRDRLPTPVFLGFPCGSVGKESACNVGDLGSIPGFGRSPGEGKGYPLQYSGLENSMDCVAHGVAKSWTRLSNFHFHIFEYNRVFLHHSFQVSGHRKVLKMNPCCNSFLLALIITESLWMEPKNLTVLN